MNIDFPVILAAALIPILVGFLWYNPKTLGNAWMKAAGVTADTPGGLNMTVVFIVSYIFCVLIALQLNSITIHQWAFMSMLADRPDFGTPGSETSNELKALLDVYGDKFRTFGHGAFHGTLTGILFALPILGVNALFEKKSFKYIFINAGYWIVCLALMGGVICGFSDIIE